MSVKKRAARKGRSTTEKEPKKNVLSRDSWKTVALFLSPAAIALVVFLIYPIGHTFLRSLYGPIGDEFVGFSNYHRVVTEPRNLIALRNNMIWVLIVPAVVTSVGLIFAVLSEKVSWKMAFRVLVFMPMVISGLAAGVTFRFVYSTDPDVGAANAALRAVHEVFQPPGDYAGARPSMPEIVEEDGGRLVSSETYRPGEIAAFGFVGIPPRQIPDSAENAPEQVPADDEAITGVVWLDFTPGGEGTTGAVDPGEPGLPEMHLTLERNGEVVDRITTDRHGVFRFPDLDEGEYRIALDERNFREPYPGLTWLGPNLILVSLIFAYIWINTGFALIIIAAGLSNINRDYLDSARVEGANEWKVLTKVTIPLLRQSLMVVMVTTTISVLKIFDLVIVIAPSAVQSRATVLALEMWRASFGGARDFGLGSALAIVLFLLIIPAMLFNIRRFRLEE